MNILMKNTACLFASRASLSRQLHRAMRVAAASAVLAGCAQMPSSPGTAPASKPEDIRFSQTDRGTMITMAAQVLFDTGRSDIKPQGEAFIDSLVRAASRSDARLLIEGHTDNVGSAAANLALSESRADAVKQALMAKGIPSQRITTVGFGPSQPVASNDTEDGRATNRRSEVILLGERIENVDRDDFMGSLKGLGRRFAGAVTAVAERIQYTRPTPQTFDPNDRMRKLGPATRCGERAGGYLLIDNSALEPAELRRGEQAILTIDMHVCVPQGQRHTVTQTIRILRGKTLIASGGQASFPGTERARYHLFARISTANNMPPGTYQVESVMTLGGRSYRQTTPFTVR